MLTLTGTRGKTRAAADWRWALGALLVVVMLSFSVVVALHLARPPSKRYSNMPPPPYGYFQLQPVGSYAGSPSDAKAAAEVHRSTCEPRADNTRYNHAIPGHLRLQRETVAAHAYDPQWNKFILDRITGNFSGTTDEIFQWTAAKWGLPRGRPVGVRRRLVFRRLARRPGQRSGRRELHPARRKLVQAQAMAPSPVLTR